ncbi:uncharacterized protein LOC103037430 isoform X2 [Astyanax mexicanus]|uniref:uncharacterized protein LOC103037430 isoform X2 n=1 Tax=Astyanax mexicanus TaxID=7994 RepID=UPI0020CB5C85|nr:uncharacterized protein LOC103037430 isoform X2 [Astyanax mexicanus]
MTMAQCLSSHNLIVLLLLVLTTESKECEKWGPVTAVQNSAVTLRCPLSSPQPGITQVFWEAVHGDKTERINQCPPSCPPAGNNNRTQRCERVRTVQDNATGTGTLTISPVNSQDASWYRCTVQTGNVKNCSEVKLNVKDEPPVQHLTKGCTIIDQFHAVVNSTLTYSAPVPHPNATQIVWGINEGDQVVPITRCPSLCTSSITRRPLCERVQTVEYAASGKSSLTISPVEETDTLWLSFIVNASSCYTFRLHVKENNSQTTKECEKWGRVTAVQNSAVTLRCPLSSPQPGITQVFWEAVHDDKEEPINQCPPTCPPAGNNNRIQLCERVRTVQDNATGTETLTISPVNSQDASWYRCTVQTGNVKNCSEVYLKVKDEPPVQSLPKGCTIIDPFHAVVNSTLTYSAPVPHPNATQIMWGINEGDQVVPITRCPSLCTSSITRRPLCERVQTVEDAASGKSSLTISPVEITDSSWLSFIVNASSCYTFRLHVKDEFSHGHKIKGFSHPTPSPQTLPTQPTNTEETEVLHLTVVFTLASLGFVCTLLTLIACASVCQNKREERGMQHGI